MVLKPIVRGVNMWRGSVLLGIMMLFCGVLFVSDAKIVQAAGFRPQINIAGSAAPEIEPESSNTGKITWITGQKYLINSGDEVVFEVDYDLRLFEYLSVNGKKLEIFRDFMLEEGSTVVVLDQGYVGNLALGNYELEVGYTDGSKFKTVLAVVETVDDEESEASGGVKPITPDTGDNYMGENGGSALMVPIVVVAVLALVGFGLYKALRRYELMGMKLRRSLRMQRGRKGSYRSSFSLDYRQSRGMREKLSMLKMSLRLKKTRRCSGLTVRRVSTKMIAVGVVVLLGGLGLGINLAWVLSDKGANATLVEDVESLAITTSEESFTVDIDLSNGSKFVSTSQTVSVDAATRNGYQLFISTNSDAYNALSLNGSALGDARITASTGTVSAPRAMDNDEWGYAIDNGVFGENYTPSRDSLWAGVPVYGAKALLKSVRGATSANDTVRVYYGFYVTNNLPDGMYWGTENSTVLYTAVANFAPDYTVTYDCNGGVGNSSDEVAMGDSVKLGNSSTCTRAGYKLAGWNVVRDGTGKGYAVGSNYQAFNDLYLYAMWNVDGASGSEQIEYSYSLSYNANGGSGAPISQIRNTTADEAIFTISSEVPEYDGYTFLGWRLNNNGKVYHASEEVIVNKINSTMYAMWRSDEDGSESSTTETVYAYSLRYDANGHGTAPAVQTVTTSNDSITFTVSGDELTDDNCTFQGWSLSRTAKSASIMPNTRYTTTKTDVTLYAVWSTEHDYKLYYNANGSNASPMPETVSAKTRDTEHYFVVSGVIPNREGYRFAGWSINSGATVGDMKVGDRIKVDVEEGSKTLYAIWQKEEQFALSYNANGGSEAPTEQTTVSSVDGAYFVVSNVVPTRDGYNFLGWGTNSAAVVPDENYQRGRRVRVTTPNTVLYAVWEDDGGSPDTPAEVKYTYRLRFDINGGTGTVPSEMSGETLGSSYDFSVPSVTSGSLTRTGYVFKGWGINQYTNEIVMDGDGGTYHATDYYTVFYAIWEARYTHGVRYDLNGGASGPADAVKTSAQYTESFTVGGNPVRSDAEFQGWATSRNGAVKYHEGDTISVRGDEIINLYAVWKMQYVYTLTYNANGGDSSSVPAAQTSGKVTETSHTFDVNTTMVPTRTGYTFLGWAKNSAATVAEYAKGASGQKITVNANIKLYAVWEKNKPVLTESIKISGNQNINYNGSNVTYLTATPSPNKNAAVTWSVCKSDNTKTVSVSSAGMVTGLNSGAACVQAEANDGSGVVAKYNVYVRKKVVIVVGASQVTRMAGIDCGSATKDPASLGYECRLVNGKYRFFADIQSYTGKSSNQYVRDDTLFFVSKSGTGTPFFYEGGWTGVGTNEGMGVYTIMSKYSKGVDRKPYTDFYVYFLIAGNGVKGFTCDSISAKNELMLDRALNMNKVVQQAKNEGYRLYGYVGSAHPVRADLKGKDLNGNNVGTDVAASDDVEACVRGKRSNLKYFKFNKAMKTIIEDKYSSNFQWVSMFVDIMDVNTWSNGDYELKAKWNDYQTVMDGKHWTDETTRKYFKALLDKNDNL